MSSKRQRKHLTPEDYNALLTELGALRSRLSRVMAYEDIWPATQGIERAIDDYATEVTGNPEYFISKAH